MAVHTVVVSDLASGEAGFGLLATISVKCRLQANVYDAGNVGGANNGQPDLAESRASSGDRQQHDRRENCHTHSDLFCVNFL